jgi:hypothetical protein
LLAAGGGFTLTHWLVLDVGIHDRVPGFRFGSIGRFRGVALTTARGGKR